MSDSIRVRPRKVEADGPSTVGHVEYRNVRRVAYGAEYENTETVTVPLFTSAVSRVRVSGSVTKNLGDYNSARVEVSIERPCLPAESEERRVYLELSDLVDRMCRRELKVAVGDAVGDDF